MACTPAVTFGLGCGQKPAPFMKFDPEDAGTVDKTDFVPKSVFRHNVVLAWCQVHVSRSRAWLL